MECRYTDTQTLRYLVLLVIVPEIVGVCHCSLGPRGSIAAKSRLVGGRWSERSEELELARAISTPSHDKSIAVTQFTTRASCLVPRRSPKRKATVTLNPGRTDRIGSNLDHHTPSQ
jgi:hypothetical protein